MDPIYNPYNSKPAYQLNWGLTIFWRQEPIDDGLWLAPLQKATEPDGVRVIKHRFVQERLSQFFVSTKPHVAPAQMIRSVKGRLQHVVRTAAPKAFQRNYALRSIGAATRDAIEAYVAGQLTHHRVGDAHFAAQLARFQRHYVEVDLSKPVFSAHGQYWYNLHLAIVNEHRWTETRVELLERVCAMIERAAKKHGDRLSRLAVLPDHIHATMGCSIDRSPGAVALAYLNNCAYACGMKAFFMFSYYVGTFGEYDRGAVV